MSDDYFEEVTDDSQVVPIPRNLLIYVREWAEGEIANAMPATDYRYDLEKLCGELDFAISEIENN